MKRFSLISILFTIILSVSAQTEKNLISLDDIFRHETFSSRTVRGIVSMKDGRHYTTLNRQGQIIKHSYATGSRVEVIFDSIMFDLRDIPRITDYKLSADEKKILLTTQPKPLYRYSFTATYYICDLESKSITPLSEHGDQMMASFSPDGRKVAFVRNNNIYIKNLVDKSEQQITSDGLFNHIINGAADWVYEEEFALKTGFQWSPDSRRIAFYRFDESHVKLFHMPLFQNELYPPYYSYKYPKAGEENSVVTIHVYHLDNQTTTTMDTGPETDQYIARIKWTTNPAQLGIIRLNRQQNKIDILVADASTGKSKILYTETNKHYIEPPDDHYPIFTDDGKHFIVPSERDGFNHLYLYTMDGKLVRQLTRGNDEVRSVYGYHEKSKRVYYAGYDGSPLRTAVFFTTIDGRRRGKLSGLPGSNSAAFSHEFSYYIHFHSSLNTPNQVTLHTNDGRQISILEDNAKLKDTIREFNIPQKEFFTFTTSEGVELNGYMVKPLDFDRSRKYPVMMFQYSGPGSQRVVDRFGIGWEHYLASEGFLIVCVDGRGTGGRGEAFKKITYGQLGYYESIDQIETGKYLQGLSYVDPGNIGIYGWSYGGYMAALCLFKAPVVFSMAIAGAPVTNWRFYDTIYTERYMGKPQDNPAGYDDNSPINHVDGMEGKFLLIHGTADDNVHVQNTIELAAKLIEAGKQFDMMLYPDKNHGIRDVKTRMHLYTLMTNFMKNVLTRDLTL
jgi:dipeptidyl-peptidase 4